MSETPAAKRAKTSRVTRVKNKAPAELQITAEQLLREAKERQLEIVPAPPKQKIQDAAELADFQLRKRKEFEDAIRKNRVVIANWIKYAAWEETQRDIPRARSVYERALDMDHRNIALWLKYAEMEMRNKQVNHARNLWDRAVTILPRANQLWYKYVYMEEMLENLPGCRAVFERWMNWEPDEQAWQTYINFELRYKELDRARDIYVRFVYVHPEPRNWIKYARFEEKNGFIKNARAVYERSVEYGDEVFGEDYLDEKLYMAFAKFEENQKEHNRARAIYKYALDTMPKEKCLNLHKAYTVHEKKYGDRAGIERVISRKREQQYEAELEEDSHNYDAWFDLIKLVMSEDDFEKTRETFERAVSNVPPMSEKRFWRRYIYLWINYALFEELEAKDYDRSRQVYRCALDLVPHKKFTFAKLWLLYAHFEVRQKKLETARQALGNALGKCPKSKLFRGYIDLEIQLREFSRCRLLYEKFLLFDPENCSAWMKFAELESLLGETERSRAIFELAISQPRLDMPEILWKAYIDFEIEQDEKERGRKLYRQLLEKTSHVKVWLSLAQFEMESEGLERARSVFEEGNRSLRANSADESVKEHRVLLLEAWRQFESEHGDKESRDNVEKLMPKRIKRRRKRGDNEDNETEHWEEFFDYIFPEDEASRPNLKLLAMAKKWKMGQQEQTPHPSNEGDKKGDEENQRDDDKEGDMTRLGNKNKENPDQEDQSAQSDATADDIRSNVESTVGNAAEDDDDKARKAESQANLDADDEAIRNESSSSSSEEEEDDDEKKGH